MSSSLSSSAVDVINRTIDPATVVTPETLGSTLEDVYEVCETASEIVKRNFQRVG
jgi:hypothetical protein